MLRPKWQIRRGVLPPNWYAFRDGRWTYFATWDEAVAYVNLRIRQETRR